MIKKILLLALILFSTQFTVCRCYAEQHYSHTNSKGKTYYLFSKEVKLKNTEKTRLIYYFSKDSKNSKGQAVIEFPENKKVSETKNGLPVLKNK